MSTFPKEVIASGDEAYRLARNAIPAGRRSDLFFLGYGVEAALYYQLKTLESHAYFVGPVGSGKGARLIALVLDQLIHAGQPTWFFDPKGDPALLGHVLAAGESAGRKAHVFSLEPGLRGFSCNILDAFSLQPRGPRQLAELLVSSLGLDQARDHYFVTQATNALTAAIKAVLKKKQRLTFKTISGELTKLVEGGRRFQHAVHALDVITNLADVDALNPEPGASDELKLIDLIKNGEVVYCMTPVGTESKVSSAASVSLLLKALTIIQKDLWMTGVATRKVYVVVDEFADICQAGDVKALVAQVRGIGAGLSLILAHQNVEQVEDRALRRLLLQAGLKVFLSPRDYAEELMSWSGEVAEWFRSDSVTPQDGAPDKRTTGYHEQVRPILSLDEIQDLSELEGGGIAVVGNGRPKATFFPFHTSLEESQARTKRAFATVRSRAQRSASSPAPQAPSLQPKLAALLTKLQNTTLLRRPT